MGAVSHISAGRRAQSARVAARAPGIRVTLQTGDPAVDAPLGVVSIRARVIGGRTPVRLYLYVNGDLAESWTEADGQFDFSLDEYGPGRHAVTARGVDAGGRWAGASMVVACLEVEPATAGEGRAPPRPMSS
jgi:hypothetical protein